MKKIILITLVSTFLLSMSSCLSTKCIDSVQKTGHSYKDDVDEHKNVTYTRVVELDNLSKYDVFTKSNTFFVYNYNSSNSVIQQADKERGLIIGKGLWSDLYSIKNVLNYSANHILRVDCKNGRARIMVTVQSIDYTQKDSRGNVKNGSYNPSGLYPYVTVPKIKKIFNNNCCLAMAIESKCQDLMDRLENDLKNGSTSKAIEDKNW